MTNIDLHRVDPRSKRQHRYGMTTGQTLFGESFLLVAWTRHGQPLRRRTETFASEDALALRRTRLLKRRLRAGYAVG